MTFDEELLLACFALSRRKQRQSTSRGEHPSAASSFRLGVLCQAILEPRLMYFPGVHFRFRTHMTPN
jgi:hypothetical protein